MGHVGSKSYFLEEEMRLLHRVIIGWSKDGTLILWPLETNFVTSCFGSYPFDLPLVSPGVLQMTILSRPYFQQHNGNNSPTKTKPRIDMGK